MRSPLSPEIFIWIICIATEIEEGLLYKYKIIKVKDMSKSASCESGLLAGVDHIDLEITMDLQNVTNGQKFKLEAKNKDDKMTLVCSLSYQDILTCSPKAAGECHCISATNQTHILKVKTTAATMFSENIILDAADSKSQIYRFPKIFGEEISKLKINKKEVSLVDCQVNLGTIPDFHFEFCTDNLNSPNLIIKIGEWNFSTGDKCARDTRHAQTGETSAHFRYRDKCQRSKTYPCTITAIASKTSARPSPCSNCDSAGAGVTIVWLTLIGLGLVVFTVVGYFLFKGFWSSRKVSGSFEKSSALDLSSFQTVRLAKSKSGIDIAVKE